MTMDIATKETSRFYDAPLPHILVTKNKALAAPRFAPKHLNRKLLAGYGYGKKVLDNLEEGFSVSYSEKDTAPQHVIRELPDGRRFLQKVEILPGGLLRIETTRQLSDAPR